MSGDQLDLDEVESLCAVARDEEARTWHERQDAIWQLLDVGGTVPALVAEVRRLRAQVERVEWLHQSNNASVAKCIEDGQLWPCVTLGEMARTE